MRLMSDRSGLSQLDLPGGEPAGGPRLHHPHLESGFGDWGQVFADPVVATATVLNIRGRSYRMRAYQEPPAEEGGGGAIVR
ncbi:MAG: hypothetical protein QOF51_3821 [Chloroflexota bacterium]|jgi:hypothetical protein|nr:hypothetical protein [Chloroflexota bacterium]